LRKAKQTRAVALTVRLPENLNFLWSLREIEVAKQTGHHRTAIWQKKNLDTLPKISSLERSEQDSILRGAIREAQFDRSKLCAFDMEFWVLHPFVLIQASTFIL
jgi:hypothetical protein